MRYFGIRLIPAGGAVFYLFSGLARRKSPFYINEVAIALSLSGLILYLDLMNSDKFWEKNQALVSDITRYSDLMVIDD